jgi:type IV pilus assembly protein PilA
MIVATVAHEAFRIRVVSEGPFILLLSVPFALAVASVVARLGLRRGWQHDGILLGGWSIAATGVVAISVLVVPAFKRERRSSQDSCVRTNLRQLQAAADQYYLENGATSVALSQLVGPTRYVKVLSTVAGEQYPTHYTQGVTITVTGIAGARTITYAP